MELRDDECPLRTLGIDLLVIQVYRLNTRLFPKNARVYDYLGYAYELDGNREEAIKTSKKALEIDPNLYTAKESLKELEKKNDLLSLKNVD